MWFQRAAAPELIGKPLRTSSFFFSLLGKSVASLDGWDACGYNETLWARHAGDPNYNLLNECCQRLNAGSNPTDNPIELGCIGLESAQREMRARGCMLGPA